MKSTTEVLQDYMDNEFKLMKKLREGLDAIYGKPEWFDRINELDDCQDRISALKVSIDQINFQDSLWSKAKQLGII